MAEGLSRRTVLHGLTASAVAAGSLPWVASSAFTDPATDWAAYGRAVGSAFDRMQNVGGAVAVVSADRLLHTSTYGVRSSGGEVRQAPSTCTTSPPRAASTSTGAQCS